MDTIEALKIFVLSIPAVIILVGVIALYIQHNI